MEKADIVWQHDGERIIREYVKTDSGLTDTGRYRLVGGRLEDGTWPIFKNVRGVVLRVGNYISPEERRGMTLKERVALYS